MKVFLLLILVSCSFAAFEGAENEECRTSEFMGTCVDTKKCKSINKTNTRSEICSFNGRSPIICCRNNQLIQTPRKSSKSKKFSNFIYFHNSTFNFQNVMNIDMLLQQEFRKIQNEKMMK